MLSVADLSLLGLVCAELFFFVCLWWFFFTSL